MFLVTRGKNSYFASVFIPRNELIKEAEMPQVVPCTLSEDEPIANEDD